MQRVKKTTKAVRCQHASWHGHHHHPNVQRCKDKTNIIVLVSQGSKIGRRDHKVETFIVAKNNAKLEGVVYCIASHCLNLEASVPRNPPDVDFRPRRRKEASGLRHVGKRLCVGLL